MIYLSLPNFYSNYNFNKILINALNHRNNNNNNNINFPMKVVSCHGSYSYSLWNGGRNSNFDSLSLYNDLTECFCAHSDVPIRLDFSNICIQDQDFFNTYCNLILSIHDNGSTLIEISNLKLLEYISEKFPNYNFVFSFNANSIAELSPEFIQILQDNDKISLISLSKKLFDKLNLKNLNKIELMLSDTCNQCSLEKRYQCIFNENSFQYNFSGISNYAQCPFNISAGKELNLLDDLNYYHTIGIKYFKIMSPLDNNLRQFNYNLLNNLFNKNELNVYQEAKEFI